MNIFERIKIQGFRRLRDIDIELRPLNVLIGANGSGKTSFLDVLTLLAASASGDLAKSIASIGGIESNLTALNTEIGGRARTFDTFLSKKVEGFEPIGYSVSIKPSGISYQIATEMLTHHRDPNQPQSLTHIVNQNGRVSYFKPIENKLVPPDWDFIPTETALSQVPKMYREPEEFRKSLASSTHYHVLDVSYQAPVRLPQQLREAHLPGRDGEELASCLYWMREAAPDRFEIIEDTLRVAFPNFDRLNFPPVAAGTLAMTWKELNSKQPFYMHQLSEGTLRFLWLVTLLYSPGLTDITLIDEPEVSLHPELLSILADCLRDASKRTQLIIATHADRLVRALQPDEVVVFDIDEQGAATATRADALNLVAWLKEYTLDELWTHGRMGGRP